MFTLKEFLKVDNIGQINLAVMKGMDSVIIKIMEKRLNNRKDAEGKKLLSCE